jgi:hypothetical protein
MATILNGVTLNNTFVNIYGGELPTVLFAAGEQGVWYDPSDMSTLFQDAAGTTPVTAVEQPVGRMLDKSGRGNHATQATSAARPVLSARVNLLTKTEELDDAAWTKSSATATDGATGPDGGSTADTLEATGANGTVTQSLTAVAASHIFSVWLRRKTGTGNVDISCHSGGTWVTQSITSDWARYSVTQTLTAGTRTPGIRIVTSGDEVEAWGADLRVANDGVNLPAYQRVNTETDYDTAGFPRYLRFDGTDDIMVTGSIDFTGGDKMTVFAGVRKLSDAATAIVLESSATINSFNGVINLRAPESTDQNYRLLSKGTIFSGAASPLGSYPAPRTNIVTGVSEIANDIALLRVNSVQVATSSSDQGTGNYGNHPLYIGARAGSSLRFNGRIYSLIVRGAASTSIQITNAENWVNSKTRAF